jgi:ABC-type branched-subunit amino acid transport system ATPase component/ABC-type branched-subunit amino acid transport system permease subunit
VLDRLRRASGLVRLMTTLALLTLIEGLGTVWWGSAQNPVNGFLPARPVDFGHGLVISEDRLYLLGISLVLTVALWQIYQRTRYGLATSAVAENQQTATLLGWSVSAIACANWMAGSALAGLAGVLLAPIAGLSVSALTLAVIPGLAAALVGRFSSFWLTLAGGLGIGIAQSEIGRFVATPGWSSSVPFIVVIVLIVAQGRALPLRGDLLERPVRVGSGVIRARVVIPVIVVIGVVIHQLTYNWILALTSSALLGIVSLSLVVITGYAGQISLAQLTIAGIGALAAGQASHYAHLPFELSIVVGVLAAATVGVLVGLPAVRCRGANLAVVTLGLSLIIEQLILNNPSLSGGTVGLTTGSPTLFGININFFSHPIRFAAVTVAAFILSAVLVANLRRGQTGRQLVVVRSNERAAAGAGIPVVGAKLYAFALASGLAGLAGALADFQYPQVNLQQYTTQGSILAVVNAVIGGIGYIGGALVAGTSTAGGLFSQLLSHLPGDWTIYLSAISGGVALLILLVHPHGIVDELLHRARRLGRGTNLRTTFVVEQSGNPQAAHGKQLSLRDVSVRFGAVEAVRGVSLDVRPGEIVGLIGPNGAGKTTLIDAITGMVRYQGSVAIAEQSLNGRTTRQRALAGLGRTFQTVELFDDLTVLDNLQAATDSRRLRGYLTDLVWPRRTKLPSIAVEAIADLGLADVLDRTPDSLPTGQRGLVGIARALGGNPAVLLLDEPAAGLSDTETAEIGSLIRSIASRRQLPVLLIEHDINLVASVSDRVVAMALGAVIATGPPGDVLTDPAVVSAYLGDSPSFTPVTDAFEAKP